jgi:hypothetical protein
MVESRMIKPDAKRRPDMVTRAQLDIIIIVTKSRVAAVELELYSARSALHHHSNITQSIRR